ncbi:MAG: ribonuclease D [Phototrophicaceae bacterium]
MALKPKLSPALYIKTKEALDKLVLELSGEKQIAVDTESNNMYAYHGQVCLIQVSTRQQDYIIDPLKIDDISSFGELLADDDIEKIFHAAEYDLICMKRDFGFEVHNLFDTMFASRLAGAKKFGLGDILSEYFDVEVDKRHQLDNWGKRPLPKDSLLYAQMDTHYLHELRDLLNKKLADLGRLEEAQEVFADVLRIDIKERVFDPDGFWKIGKPRSLTRRQMALLKELYILREGLAEEEDQPPFKVLSNKALINLSRQQPLDYRSLYNIKGLGQKSIRRYGDEIIEAIEKGRSNNVPKQPARDDPDPIIAERYISLHAWRKKCAVQRDLDSSLILAKQTLWDIAYKLPNSREDLAKIEGLGAWRLENYGDDLLEVIQKLV